MEILGRISANDQSSDRALNELQKLRKGLSILTERFLLREMLDKVSNVLQVLELDE